MYFIALLSFILLSSFHIASETVLYYTSINFRQQIIALWYCYAVISTAGFGDVVAVTFIGKMCSVLLTIYSIFVVAIATGVVVNFYTQMVELQRKETLAMFMDQLERLPELSREELENISRKVCQFR